MFQGKVGLVILFHKDLLLFKNANLNIPLPRNLKNNLCSQREQSLLIYGVIHKVRTLTRGEGGPAKSVPDGMEEGEFQL